MTLSKRIERLRAQAALTTRYGPEERAAMIQTGEARTDGLLPIRDGLDLHHAIVLAGTMDDPVPFIPHILNRASALGLLHLVPGPWTTQPTLSPNALAALAQNMGQQLAQSIERIERLEQSTSTPPLLSPPAPEITPPALPTSQVVPLTEAGSGVGDGATSSVQPAVGKVGPGTCPACGRKLPKKRAVKQAGNKCLCGAAWGKGNFCPSCGADHRPDTEEVCACPEAIAQAATILQVDPIHRVVTAVIQAPNSPTTPGTHPDLELYYPDDAIREMAWDFLMQGRQGAVGVLHDEADTGVIVPPQGENAVVVESYLAPVTFTYRQRTIAQGSWVGAFKITSDEVWERIAAGELNAPSLATDDYELADMDEEVVGGFTVVTGT